MDNRAVSPVVEKTVAMGLVALFVAGVTTALFGGAVPDSRTVVGAELSDRVLATAVQEVEAAVPTVEGNATVRRTVELPATIRGESYRILTDGQAMVLTHPADRVGGRATVASPSVDALDGRWSSGGETAVSVTANQSGVAIELVEGAA